MGDISYIDSTRAQRYDQHMSNTLRADRIAAEGAAIARALVAHNHNRTHAADALGISRRTLLNKIQLYRLQARATVDAVASGERVASVLQHPDGEQRAVLLAGKPLAGVEWPGGAAARAQFLDGRMHAIRNVTTGTQAAHMRNNLRYMARMPIHVVWDTEDLRLIVMAVLNSEPASSE